MNQLSRHRINFGKAVGESLFSENSWFGFFLLATLIIFDRHSFISATIASLIGYIYSVRVSTPRDLTAYGLIPMNGLFFGLAMANLFRESVPYYCFLVLGALAIPVLCKAMYEVLQHWKLNPFNGPYLLAIWMVWLCARGAGLESIKIRYAHDPIFHFNSLPFLVNTLGQLLTSTFYSMARLLFVDNLFFGMLIFLAVTLMSRRKGTYFFLGSFVATCIAFLFSKGSGEIHYSLYSYSAGLIGLGLASFPQHFKWHKIILFCVFSSILTLSLSVLFTKIDLPLLTMPYVLTLWLSLLSRSPQISVAWAPAKKFETSLATPPFEALPSAVRNREPALYQ